VATRLLEHGLSEEPGDPYRIARAAGRLSPGAAGRREYEDVESEVRVVEELVKNARGAERASSLSIHRLLPVDASAAGTLGSGPRLSGELAGRFTNGLVLHHYSRFRGKYLLVAWLKHLFLSWCAADGEPKKTTLIARPTDASKRPEHWRFDAVSAPETELSRLVELYDSGQTRPLLLLPSASLAYALARRDGQSHEAALRAARASWNDGHRFTHKPAGECDDPHYKRVFGEDWWPGMPPPFAVDGPSFEELAERIFGPLLAHAERGR
jgi:exonuclease V gamma subunit